MSEALGPVALVGLVVTVALIALFHRAEFAGAVRLDAPRPKVDELRIPKDLSELKGCWQSESGEIPLYAHPTMVRIGTSRSSVGAW